MIENPYQPGLGHKQTPSGHKCFAHDMVVFVFASLLVAFAIYWFELITGFTIHLKYSFPSFYPIRSVMYFDPLFGFCVQFVSYGAFIGLFKHLGRLDLGVIVVVGIHVAQVLVCPYLG